MVHINKIKRYLSAADQYVRTRAVIDNRLIEYSNSKQVFEYTNTYSTILKPTSPVRDAINSHLAPKPAQHYRRRGYQRLHTEQFQVINADIVCAVRDALAVFNKRW